MYTGSSSVHWNVTGIPLVDPVYTGIPLGRVHWNTAGKKYLKQPHTGMSLEKRSRNCPTLGCQGTTPTLQPTLKHHRREYNGQHTHQAHIVKQSSIHVSLKWQDGGTPINKWKGLSRFSFYLEFIALQWIPFLLLKHVSISTSRCACLWYEHHYSFYILGVASQMKSVKLEQLEP